MFLWNQRQSEVVRASRAELKRSERRCWRGCMGPAAGGGTVRVSLLGRRSSEDCQRDSVVTFAFSEVSA